MKQRRSMTVYQMTLGGLYLALFAVIANVPTIQLVPDVPFTLQILLVAMLGLTLGLRGGMITYAALLLMTLAGLPMMSNGRGGPAALLGPTSGYIYGWVFMIVLMGLYSGRFMDALIERKWRGMSLHIPVCVALGAAAVAADYACGALGLIAFSGGKYALSAFPALFAANFPAFFPFDLLKAGLASVLSLAMFAKPALRRALHLEEARG